MKAAFDDSASTYDADFTNTPIGKLQRDSVWHYLHSTYKNGFPNNVLELNCGTGEDAIFFGSKGCNVTATDVSAAMLDMTNNKIRMHGLEQKINTVQLDIRNIGNEHFDEPFDLVFSNFGGLNCVDATHLSHLFKRMTTWLRQGGRMILVVMPRFCAWESLYFLSRLEPGQAFRRRKKEAQRASLGSSGIDIWYYDPAQIQALAAPYFKTVHIQPIGIAVPPSYFKNSMIGREKILRNLNAAEKKLNKFKPLSRIADHYLIDLELK